MNESKHTPGPWIRDRESGFDCDVRASNGRKVASVNVQCMAKTKKQFDGRKSENEANARLIAAAPEMLQRLGMCKRFLEDMHTQSPEVKVAASQTLHETVSEIIAQATGK